MYSECNHSAKCIATGQKYARRKEICIFSGKIRSNVIKMAVCKYNCISKTLSLVFHTFKKYKIWFDNKRRFYFLSRLLKLAPFNAKWHADSCFFLERKPHYFFLASIKSVWFEKNFYWIVYKFWKDKIKKENIRWAIGYCIRCVLEQLEREPWLNNRVDSPYKINPLLFAMSFSGIGHFVLRVSHYFPSPTVINTANCT